MIRLLGIVLLAVMASCIVNAAPSDKKRSDGQKEQSDRHALVFFGQQHDPDAEASADAAAKQKEETDRRIVEETTKLAKYTLWLSVFTCLIMAIAIGQFVMFLFQWQVLRRQADSADEAFLITNRPRITIKLNKPGKIELMENSLHVGFHFEFYNSGNTPTVDMEYQIRPVDKPVSSESFDAFVRSEPTGPRTGFDASFLLGKDSFPWNSHSAREFGVAPDITKGVFLLCIVKYKFSFGKQPRPYHYTAKLFQFADNRPSDMKTAEPKTNYLSEEHVAFFEAYRSLSD